MSRLKAARASGLGRGVWNIADQVVSSGNNFLLQVVVAQFASENEFGFFAIAFAVFSVTIGFMRALATTPVAMRFSGSDDAEFRRAASGALGLAATASVVVGALIVAVALLAPVSSTVQACLVALGIVLPGLVLQDAWRQVLFARLRPKAATLLDSTWGVLQVAAVVLLLVQGVHSPVPYVVAWGSTALAASFVGVLLARHWPRPAASWAWLREQWSATRYLVPEFLVLQGGNQAATILVAIVLGEAAAGAMRGGNLLTAPVAILGTGLVSFLVPEFSRRRATLTARQWWAGAYGLAAVVGLAGIVWGSMFLVLPDAFGRTVLRDSWDGTRQVLLPIIVGQAATAVGGGPTTMLYAMDRARDTLRVHLVLAALVVVLPVTFALQWGLVGAAWGIAAAFWAVVPFWLVKMRRAVREVTAEQAATTAPVDGSATTTGVSP